MRPSTSEVPPAANGAMNLTGRLGHACAWASGAACARPSPISASSKMRRLIMAGLSSRSLGGVLEGEHILRRAEVDAPAVLDHPGQVMAALQNADVGQRI